MRETITPKDGLSLVAGRDGRVVGHVMFTRGLLDAPRRLVDVHVLSPLADDAFQAVRLPAYEPWMTGTLVYAEPFWSHDCVGRRDPGVKYT